MADSILNTATFATANMKPAASGGENIDAIWGRNVADNTGYLFYQKKPAASFGLQLDRLSQTRSAGTFVATQWVTARRETPYLHGSYSLRGTTNLANHSLFGSFFKAGPTYIAGTTLALTSGGGEKEGAGSFIWDMSALTHGQDYPMYAFMSCQADGIQGMYSITTWYSNSAT